MKALVQVGLLAVLSAQFACTKTTARNAEEPVKAESATKSEAAPPADTRSLYARLGGKESITAVVNDFVNSAATDKRIAVFFKATVADKKRVVRLKSLLVDQICEATGGPCKYTGKQMKDAHKGMGVKEAHFNAMVEDLVAVLDKYKVGAREKDELLAALGGMKKDIVTK